MPSKKLTVRRARLYATRETDKIVELAEVVRLQRKGQMGPFPDLEAMTRPQLEEEQGRPSWPKAA
jgi:hypothetical protein